MTAPSSAPTVVLKPEKDRRRSERQPLVVQAWLSSPTATDPLDRREVLSVNVSRHGLAFDHKAALPVGTFHIIDLAMGEQRIRCEIRIMSCRTLEDGSFEIGAEFC
jgi:hypothetical protein